MAPFPNAVSPNDSLTSLPVFSADAAFLSSADCSIRTNPGGNGPTLAYGALGGREGVVGCLVAAPPVVEAGMELLFEDVDGLESGADEGPRVCTCVSEAAWPWLVSVGAIPLVEDAEGEEKPIKCYYKVTKATGSKHLQNGSCCSAEIRIHQHGELEPSPSITKAVFTPDTPEDSSNICFIFICFHTALSQVIQTL